MRTERHAFILKASSFLFQNKGWMCVKCLLEWWRAELKSCSLLVVRWTWSTFYFLFSCWLSDFSFTSVTETDPEQIFISEEDQWAHLQPHTVTQWMTTQLAAAIHCMIHWVSSHFLHFNLNKQKHVFVKLDSWILQTVHCSVIRLQMLYILLIITSS